MDLVFREGKLVSVIHSLHGPNDLGHWSKPRCECHSAKASHWQKLLSVLSAVEFKNLSSIVMLRSRRLCRRLPCT
jgi:hypothetical protein